MTGAVHMVNVYTAGGLWRMVLKVICNDFSQN